MSDVNKEIGLYPMSGDVVRFVSTAKLPIGGFETELHPIQDLHGYEYPWPAGGGKNLFDLKGFLDANNAPYTETNDVYTINLSAGLLNNPFVFSESNITVTISAEVFASVTARNFRLELLNSSNQIVKAIYALSTFPVTASGCKIRFNWGAGGTVTVGKVQVEEGSTATTYAPYSNICPITGSDSVTVYVSPEPAVVDGTEKYEIEFGQTVYAGTLTINEDGSGQIVSTMASVDLGTLNWAYNPTYLYFYSNIANRKIALNNVISDRYVPIESALDGNQANATIKASATNNRVFITNHAYTDEPSFKTAMSGSQLVYELAEPITINLTVEQIETLIGFNYVWNNVGTTNITFQYYTGGEGMAITFLDCWTYPKAKLDEMFKAVTDRLDALEEASEEASADSNTKTTLLETKEELATEPVAEVEREGDE